jgi:hypothetical protein
LGTGSKHSSEAGVVVAGRFERGKADTRAAESMTLDFATISLPNLIEKPLMNAEGCRFSEATHALRPNFPPNMIANATKFFPLSSS